MDLSTCVTERLESAQEVFKELPEGLGQPNPFAGRLVWLERQLANLIAQLQAMQADIEAGCSILEMGYLSEDEFQEMLDDLGIEIANLKGMVRTLKMLER